MVIWTAVVGDSGRWVWVSNSPTDGPAPVGGDKALAAEVRTAAAAEVSKHRRSTSIKSVLVVFACLV